MEYAEVNLQALQFILESNFLDTDMEILFQTPTLGRTGVSHRFSQQLDLKGGCELQQYYRI